MIVPASADPSAAESPIFVDSNVLLYALDEANPAKQQAAQKTGRRNCGKSAAGGGSAFRFSTSFM